MSATKTCPGCGAEVPEGAARCKDCFHDFAEPPSRLLPAILVGLGALTLVSVMALIVVAFIALRPADQRVLVSAESQSVVWTTMTSTGDTKTETLKFDEISKLIYHSAGGHFEIIAVDKKDGEHIIEFGGEPMMDKADGYGRIMGKEVEVVDETKGQKR